MVQVRLRHALLLLLLEASAAKWNVSGWAAVDPALTPYFPNASLNVALVPTLALNCVKNGVDVVLLGGSNGEWPSQTHQERLLLLAAWTTALKALRPVYAAAVPKLMFHAGHTDVGTAKMLAAAAEAAKVDFLLAVAPGIIFTPTDPAVTVAQLAAIAASAPSTPFYYYHYPKIYVVDLPMAVFVPLALETIPTFAGVKYIDANYADIVPAAAAKPSLLDWFVQSGLTLPMMPYGGNGAPIFTWQVPFARAVASAYRSGDNAGAAAAQVRMLALNAIMAQYGGTAAARACYKVIFGVDLGPIRPPQIDLTPTQVAAMVVELQAGGFLPASALQHKLPITV